VEINDGAVIKGSHVSCVKVSNPNRFYSHIPFADIILFLNYKIRVFREVIPNPVSCYFLSLREDGVWL
jgi:hypothetical protein